MKLFNKKNDQKRVARRRLTQENPKAHQKDEGHAEYYSYRRNRTLTGSLSSNVSSATERSAELRSPRVQSHDLRRHRRRLSGLLFGSLSLAVFLGFLVYQSIGIVRVEPGAGVVARVDTDAYARLISGYLAVHPFERFRFSLDEVALARYLQDNGAPEVESVSPMSRYSGFGQTTLTLLYRHPVVSWNTGRSEMYVDKTGAAFERNYFANPDVKVIDKSGIQTSGNQVVTSGRFLGFMGKIIGRMSEQGLFISSITLPAGTTRQVEVTVQGLAYPIKFSTDRPTGEQAEDAGRAVRYLKNQGITAEYLDVRVGGKAYYK